MVWVLFGIGFAVVICRVLLAHDGVYVHSHHYSLEVYDQQEKHKLNQEAPKSYGDILVGSTSLVVELIDSLEDGEKNEPNHACSNNNDLEPIERILVLESLVVFEVRLLNLQFGVDLLSNVKLQGCSMLQDLLLFLSLNLVKSEVLIQLFGYH